MPIAVTVALVSLLAALVLYSVGVWGAFRAGEVRRAHVNALYAGFVFDVLATLGMGVQAGGLDLSPPPDLLHTVLALLAMSAMLAVAVIASRALAADDRPTIEMAPRWMLSGWALWMLVFVWGMVARGASRIGA